MSASNDHADNNNNDQAGSGSPLTSISATNRGPTLTLPPPPAMNALSANLRLREDETSLIDSFSLHLNNYLGTDDDDDGGGDDSDDTNATDTSDVTWLTYRDEKCNEVKEEFIRRLKLESGDRVLSVEERRALLEGIVREQGRRDEVEKERRKRIVEEEEEGVMSDFGEGGESDDVEDVEDSVDGGRRDREEDYEDEECIRRSTDSHPHPAALFDANHNFVGIGRGPSGSLPSSSGGGGPSSSFHSSSVNNHHHNSSMQPSVMRYNSSGGRIMGGLDLVKEETRSDIRAAGGSRSQHDSLTTSNHSNSQQQQQQTSMNAPPSPQHHHHHYTQQINQEHINSIVNLKLLVANQQAMLDALSSKLHNAELANNILQSENKILTQNNEMIQQQLIRKTREVVEMKREVLGLETRLLQQSQQQQQSASSSTFAPPTTNNAISAQEQFTIRALESRMKKMDQMNKMLMQDKMQMQREMAMLKRKADDSGSSSESFIVKRVESYVKKSDTGSGDSSAAFAKVAEDEPRKDVPPLLPPEGQQTSLPVAPEGSTDSSSSGGGKKKKHQQQPKKHTDVVPSVRDTTAVSSRRSSASSSSSEPPLDFLRNKKTQLPPEREPSLVAAPPSLAAPPGSDTSSSRSKKKIEVIPSMQDSPEASKLSSSMEIVKNIRRTRFADQQERSSTSGSCRIQGSGKTYSDGGRESSAKGSTSGTAVVEPVRYKSQIASSNKLFGDTKLLSGLVTRLGISSRLSNRGESTMRVEDLSKELIPLVGSPKFCAMIYNVLSPEECAGLIRRAKVEQFEELSYYRRSSGSEPANISCCKRCRLSDSGLAVDLFTKISDALKGTPLEREFQRRPSVEDYEDEEEAGVADGSVMKGKRPGASVTRISEPFNVIRYDVGEFFAPHRDNTFRTGTEVSRLTLQVFLNEKFSGGVTSIRHGKKFFDIKPKMGSVLLVDQELRREECYVVSGKKYVVRADVMYDECKVDGATAVTERSAYTRDTRESGYTRETNPL